MRYNTPLTLPERLFLVVGMTYSEVWWDRSQNN
nr:MAG TPA: hypothetical protein [Caudoviricetes sp.]